MKAQAASLCSCFGSNELVKSQTKTAVASVATSPLLPLDENREGDERGNHACEDEFDHPVRRGEDQDAKNVNDDCRHDEGSSNTRHA
jgi:hypothetical protein